MDCDWLWVCDGWMGGSGVLKRGKVVAGLVLECVVQWEIDLVLE